MVQASHQGTRNIPLKLAEALTAVVNTECEKGIHFFITRDEAVKY